MVSATWKKLAGLHQADRTPTTQEHLQNFAKPCRVLEEHPNPAQNDPETWETSDNFLSMGEFPHEIGSYDDSNDSENLTENPLQDHEGVTPTNSASPIAGRS